MTYNEMARYLLKEAELNGKSSISVEKSKLMNLRTAMATMNFYAGLDITTRYDKENSVLSIFIFNSKD